MFHIKLGEIEQLQNLIYSRGNHTIYSDSSITVVLGGVGGTNRKRCLEECEYFDFELLQFLYFGNLQISREYTGVAKFSESLYAFGGRNHNGYET